LALHPAIRIADQIADVIAAHKSFARRAVREHALQILAAVFPSEVERIANSYPHQLSGGQRARVLIAQAISCGPSLIVADEPTASLDPEMQQEVLALFRALRPEVQSLPDLDHPQSADAGGIRGSRARLVCRPSG